MNIISECKNNTNVKSINERLQEIEKMKIESEKLKKDESIEMKNHSSSNYENKAIQTSCYGDTLELSKENERTNTYKMIYSDNGAKGKTNMTDITLEKFSKDKLKQLLLSRKITKQQYEKAIKKHK